MSLEGYSTSISLHLILLFISPLNFSTSVCLLYLLSLSACLNKFVQSRTLFYLLKFSYLYQLIIFSSKLSNSANESSVNGNSQLSNFRFVSIFSLQTSADSSYTYIKIHYTYSSTIFSLIPILIYIVCILSQILLPSLDLHQTIVAWPFLVEIHVWVLEPSSLLFPFLII